jgi:hypothetical protein
LNSGQLLTEPEDIERTRRSPSPRLPAMSVDTLPRKNSAPESSATLSAMKGIVETSIKEEHGVASPWGREMISVKAEEFQNLSTEDKKLLVMHGISSLVQILWHRFYTRTSS